MRFIHFIIFVINKFKWAISGVYIPNVDFFFYLETQIINIKYLKIDIDIKETIE